MLDASQKKVPHQIRLASMYPDESDLPHVPAAHRRCPANPNCALLPTSDGCYLDPMFDLPDLAGTARLKWGGVENLLSIRSTIRSTMSPQRDACPLHAYLPDTHPMHTPLVCAVRGGRLEAPHETALYARFACGCPSLFSYNKSDPTPPCFSLCLRASFSADTRLWACARLHESQVWT